MKIKCLLLLPLILLIGCITFPSTAVQSGKNLESSHRSTTQSFSDPFKPMVIALAEKYPNDVQIKSILNEVLYFETTLQTELESIKALVRVLEAAEQKEDK